MMKQRWMCVVTAMVLTVQSVGAADLGRQPVTAVSSPGRVGGESMPVERAYQGDILLARLQAEFDLGWNSLDWEVGDSKFKAAAWAPQACVAYGVNDRVDVRGCIKVLSATDSEKDSSADVSFVRLGLGSRVWFAGGQDFVPYVGGYLNYYMLDVESRSVSGMFGLSAEAGVAYLFNEWFAMHVGVHGETSVADGTVRVEGEDEKVALTSVGLGLGVTVLF
mgnify:CR=1 FL=1